MSTAVLQPQIPPPPDEKPAQPNYLNVAYGVRSWLFTLDHKRIGILYLLSITLMFFIGGAFAVLFRLELMTPEGDLVLPETYNKLFTMHGIIMIWFFLVPSIPAVFGNFVVPIMIGAKDMAFPRLNLASWYLFMIGSVIMIWAVINGGVDSGWTFYPPLSTEVLRTQVSATIVAVFITGFSSILTGINVIVTAHRLRAPGMWWSRLPLFVWAIYATSLIIVLATPVLAVALALLVVERVAGVGIFDPRLGGDPVLFQHLFWFYSHPAVYIMILPGLGVVSEVIPCFSRKMIFGYPFIAAASVAIAVFSFLVWGHHIFVAGQSRYASLVFSLLSYSVAVPSAIKVFNWTATIYKGRVSFEAPMLYGLGFIGLFTLGGVTGLFLASTGMDVHVHDTYFVVAHFHYIMVGGMVMAYMASLHFWWPKMTGRMYPEGWARLAALIIFVGFNLTFFPQYVVGYLGMPRRYHAYPEDFHVLNVMSTAGSSILGVGYLIPFFYFLWSLRWAPPAGPNPWGATGLEWQIPSPPPPHNFDRTPTVEHPPYLYGMREPDHG